MSVVPAQPAKQNSPGRIYPVLTVVCQTSIFVSSLETSDGLSRSPVTVSDGSLHVMLGKMATSEQTSELSEKSKERLMKFFSITTGLDKVTSRQWLNENEWKLDVGKTRLIFF